MSHQTFKVSILIDDSVENFYIKHYVDEYQPIFGKFKNLVFQRNPFVNSPNLKIYWIDGENDKILISCEEDFRLYIEQGQGKKVFFHVTSKKIQPQVEDEDDEPMDADDVNDRKGDRRSRKSARDEEKQRRATKRLAEKMRHAEEKLKVEEERRSRNPELKHEKYERKNAERLEKARRRCEQIRQILYGSTDPANLHDASASGCNTDASTSTARTSIEDSMAILHPSAETIRLLSSAIAGCLQPCNLINKILTDIIGMVPTPAGDVAPPTPAGNVASPTQPQQQRSFDQQQQTEIAGQNIATNTSFLNTPVTTAHPSSQEIEALFKEAAKELEKMNEIVNSSKSMEGSVISMGSSTSAVTQIPKHFTESTNSESTVVGVSVSQDAVPADNVDGRSKSPEVEDDFKILSPPKSMRSRESSIEVHDVNSMMSDDSRDWTMLDAIANEQEEDHTSPLLIPPTSLNTTFASAVGDNTSMTSATAETQTPSELLIQSEASAQSQIQSSIQKSMEAVGELNQMVKNSVELAQKSLDSIQKPVQPITPKPIMTPSAPVEIPVLRLRNEQTVQPTVSSSPAQAPADAATSATFDPKQNASRYPPLGTLSALTQANLNANRLSTGAKPKVPQMGPAVVVYDPNPKINSAVHTMLAMGFSNEGGWLTQLLLNVDGDVPKAIAFLTPQPKTHQQ